MICTSPGSRLRQSRPHRLLSPHPAAHFCESPNLPSSKGPQTCRLLHIPSAAPGGASELQVRLGWPQCGQSVPSCGQHPRRAPSVPLACPSLALHPSHLGGRHPTQRGARRPGGPEGRRAAANGARGVPGDRGGRAWRRRVHRGRRGCHGARSRRVRVWSRCVLWPVDSSGCQSPGGGRASKAEWEGPPPSPPPPLHRRDAPQIDPEQRPPMVHGHGRYCRCGCSILSRSWEQFSLQAPPSPAWNSTIEKKGLCTLAFTVDLNIVGVLDKSGVRVQDASPHPPTKPRLSHGSWVDVSVCAGGRYEGAWLSRPIAHTLLSLKA